MARSVDEINIGNFQNTGQTTPFPRYTFNLEIKWVDNDGEAHTYNQQHTFPNDLGSMPLAVRRRFAEQMITATARVALGLNDWSEWE